jgi:hypothetical protein
MKQASARQYLNDIVANIRAAELLLVQASRQTSDLELLIKLHIEYSALDSYLSQVLHALALSDDAFFKTATDALKQQCGVLQQEAEDIGVTVPDFDLASEIARYLAQASQSAAML